MWVDSLGAPVLYPGSTDRTSFAEREEQKGYLLLELAEGEPVRWRLVPLPTRPMLNVPLPLGPDLRGQLQRRLASLPPDAIVRLQPDGPLPAAAWSALGSRSLRTVAPAGMSVSVAGQQRRAAATQRG